MYAPLFIYYLLLALLVSSVFLSSPTPNLVTMYDMYYFVSLPMMRSSIYCTSSLLLCICGYWSPLSSL